MWMYLNSDLLRPARHIFSQASHIPRNYFVVCLLLGSPLSVYDSGTALAFYRNIGPSRFWFSRKMNMRVISVLLLLVLTAGFASAGYGYRRQYGGYGRRGYGYGRRRYGGYGGYGGGYGGYGGRHCYGYHCGRGGQRPGPLPQPPVNTPFPGATVNPTNPITFAPTIPPQVFPTNPQVTFAPVPGIGGNTGVGVPGGNTGVGVPGGNTGVGVPGGNTGVGTGAGGCRPCAGGATQLTLQYRGTTAINVLVTTNTNEQLFSQNVPAGGRFNVARANGQPLGPAINLVSGTPPQFRARRYTDCSRPIYISQTLGQVFQIVDGNSLTGGRGALQKCF
eukprot:812140_1